MAYKIGADLEFSPNGIGHDPDSRDAGVPLARMCEGTCAQTTLVLHEFPADI